MQCVSVATFDFISFSCVTGFAQLRPKQGVSMSAVVRASGWLAGWGADTCAHPACHLTDSVVLELHSCWCRFVRLAHKQK